MSPTHRRLVDIDVLAEWLATSPRHIRRLVAERRVPFVKVGHFIRFDPNDITLWIEEQKVTIDED
jgi:excisionase family DNA binding protein